MTLSKETIDHLNELRKRLIYCVICYFTLFSLFFYSSHFIFNILSEPLLKFLPQSSNLVATDITTPVIMPIKLSLNLAIYCVLPIIIFNIWKFIAPGLYRAEKQYIIPLVISSLVLFFIGNIFAYFFILPLMFNVFVLWLPPNVALMADINNYLNFIFNMLLIFGLVFEIPLLIIILIRLNIITHSQLVSNRKYFILLAFIVSMLLTPPDVISMILLAVPICLLYEIGLFISRNHNSKISCDQKTQDNSLQQ